MMRIDTLWMIALSGFLQFSFADKCRIHELTKEPPFSRLSFYVTRDFQNNFLVESEVAFIPPEENNANFSFDFIIPSNKSKVAAVKIIHEDNKQTLSLWCEGMEEDNKMIQDPFSRIAKHESPIPLRLQIGEDWLEIRELGSVGDKLSGQVSCGNLTSFPHLEIEAKCEAKDDDKCGSISQNCAVDGAGEGKDEDTAAGFGIIGSATAVFALLVLLAAV